MINNANIVHLPNLQFILSFCHRKLEIRTTHRGITGALT